MNCFVHRLNPAVGVCAVCQKAVCGECVAEDTPRVVCVSCRARGGVIGGFEYRSRTTIAGWPLVHVCAGMNPVTMRPKVARGVVAIGNIAVGGVAVGGLAAGIVTFGGLSLGVLGAVGGAAIGVGLSLGGFAVGAVAVGGAAVGFFHAVGGAAIGPSVVDGRQCAEATRDVIRQWLGSSLLPPHCR